MKKSLWQIGLLSVLLALSACSKKVESDQSTESKDVPISAAPAEPAQALPIGEDTGQTMKEASSTEQTQGAEDASLVDVPEIVDFDEEAAKTATADAEVEDDAEK